MDLPATRIMSTLEWDDLVVDKQTMQQLDDIKIWLEHRGTRMNERGTKKQLNPGYRTLFHGPPGTGKTLSASLLGKLSGLDVYRVDLSSVVSKYIGETEKNLEKVVAQAEDKNWILFFDEADALFGKRTSISDSHDKYANQEIAYLLQRLEDYNGLVILSTTMRSNLDETFSRRLNSVIHFPVPKSPERLTLWKKAFSDQRHLAEDLDLAAIAEDYELAGGSIINAAQYASRMALSRKESVIHQSDILSGIRKESRKKEKQVDPYKVPDPPKTDLEP